jgi:hypothetical protein
VHRLYKLKCLPSLGAPSLLLAERVLFVLSRFAR